MHQVATWLHAFNSGEGRTSFSSPALYRAVVRGQEIDGVWHSSKQAVMHTKGQII